MKFARKPLKVAFVFLATEPMCKIFKTGLQNKLATQREHSADVSNELHRINVTVCLGLRAAFLLAAAGCPTGISYGRAS